MLGRQRGLEGLLSTLPSVLETAGVPTVGAVLGVHGVGAPRAVAEVLIREVDNANTVEGEVGVTGLRVTTVFVTFTHLDIPLGARPCGVSPLYRLNR